MASGDILQDFGILKAKGNEKFKAKDYGAAKRLYSQALELKGDEAVGYSNRAACNLQLRQYYHALNDCNKAIRLDPKFCKAFFRRGSALRELSRFKSALEDFEQVLRLEPDNNPAKDEAKRLKGIIENNARLILNTYNKAEEFCSKKPMQRFPLNNQYMGSKLYIMET